VKSYDKNGKRYALVLAGGAGQRLSGLTRQIAGEPVPKQFCPVIGNASLIEQTIERISISIPKEHTLAVVTRAHEPYYKVLLVDMPPRNLVVQPENRGTAPAILYSLLRISKITPDACVAVFPSDHFVSDAEEFMRHVEMAFAAARSRPELTILLGIEGESPQTGYGWIEPGAQIPGQQGMIFKVRRFWEKPASAAARQLLQRGWLTNSFILVSRVSSLLGLFVTALPELYASFTRIYPALMTASEERAIDRLYARIESVDFSREVLVRNPIKLAVLRAHGFEWSALGDPERVLNLWTRLGIQPHWHAA
jgi:mannose-1-phosphate guanylyltransferase